MVAGITVKSAPSQIGPKSKQPLNSQIGPKPNRPQVKSASFFYPRKLYFTLKISETILLPLAKVYKFANLMSTTNTRNLKNLSKKFNFLFLLVEVFGVLNIDLGVEVV